MSPKTRAPPFWRVLARWREKHGRMPHRRSGFATSRERQQEEALAKRVERWSRENALPLTLATQLKSWVAAERCGTLLGQVTAFRASCGRMPQRQHCRDDAKGDEDNLARRVKRYCERASLGAGYASASDLDSTYCSDQQISDCGRLSSMVTEVCRDHICPHVLRMFDIFSMNMRTAGTAGEWRFVLMICVAVGLRTLNDFGTANLTLLTQLSFFGPAVRNAIPQVSAFARCFHTLMVGFQLGLRSISAFHAVDHVMIQSLVTHTGMNESSVRWALSEIYSVSRHARGYRHPPALKHTCLPAIGADEKLSSSFTADSVPPPVLPRLCAELQRCWDLHDDSVAQLPHGTASGT